MSGRISATAVFAAGLFASACGGPGGSQVDTADQSGTDPAAAAQAAREQEAPAVGVGSTPSGADRSWSFDDIPLGGPPAGWRIEQTNPRGEGAAWAVMQNATAPSGDQVLSLTDPRGARGSTYNLVWTDEVAFQDGRIEVKVRAGAGREDQGGGPIWRVQDKDNYYIARWNPLENNFRLYFVREGSRREIESANVNVPAGEWHTIAIEHRGNRITGYLDGERMWETTDDTFSAPGGIGLWTKADAATSFDDLVAIGGSP